MIYDTIKKADVRPVKALLLKIAKELDAGKHDNFYAETLGEKRKELENFNVSLATFRVTADHLGYHKIVCEPKEMQVLFVLMAREALTDVYDVAPN